MASACEKELDFHYKDIPPIPVFEAALTADDVRLSITYTSPMGAPLDRTRVTDATVILTDVTDGSAVALTADTDGYFTAPTGGATGHTYRLDIDMADGHFMASSTIPAPVEITDIEFGWIKMPYDHVAVLKTTFTDNPATPGECYWLRIYRNGVFYKWMIVTDSSAIDGSIESVTMTSRMDLDKEDEADALRQGDVVSVVVAPVNRPMFDYLQAIANDSNGPAMFDGPLSLGYFLAAPLAKGVITFTPSEMKYY